MDKSKLETLYVMWKELRESPVLNIVVKDSNKDLWFKENIEENTSYEVAKSFLDLISEKHQVYKKEQQKLELEKLKAEIRVEADEMLLHTGWSMLSDAPLSQEGKKLYRDYRQYLRDIIDLWENKQINELKVMTFDEWRDNTPVYKVEKKVIL